MSADLPSSNPPAADERAPVPRASAGAGGALLMLTLVVALVALLMSGILWQKLEQTQKELARQSAESASDAKDARSTATETESQFQELQARLSVAEVRLSEVSLQRSQLEELMLTLSRSRDDNLVQDLESALRLAQQQTQLTGSAQPLVSALQAADQRIARAAQPRLNPVQRAIARDIERIQSAALADIPTLALRLDELARQVDDWPVANAVGARADAQAAAFVKPPRADTTGQGPAGGTATATVTDGPPAAEAEGSEPGLGWRRISAGWSELWERVWLDVTRSGRELVRVSRIDRPEAALLAPEQAFFLRQNIKLKLLNARLGLLARHMSSSQADVAAVEAAVQRYFDTRSPRVASALGVLAELRQDLVDAGLPRPEESLAALAVAAGGR